MNDLNKDKSFSTPEKKSKTLIPYAMLCELTHRCPLSCPYCSNPVELELKSNEISTDLWKTALSDGAKIGILQAHFSGGEPTARKDLEELVSHASKIGLYTNLITSGVLINEDRLKKLYDSGLEHVQVSIQDTDPNNSEKIAGFKGHNKKIAVIDSQDALIGNSAYDLASLIDDVRLKTSNELKDKVFKFYIKTNKKIDLKKFKKDFEILSVLRNLKIIGIFMRLAERDNKKKYLKLIPYAWDLINYRIKEQNQFNNLMLLLKNNFPKFIR